MSQFPRFDRFCDFIAAPPLDQLATPEGQAFLARTGLGSMTPDEHCELARHAMSYAAHLREVATLAEALVGLGYRYGVAKGQPLWATLEPLVAASGDLRAKTVLHDLEQMQRDTDEAAQRLEIAWWKPGSTLVPEDKANEPFSPEYPDLWLYALRAGMLDDETPQ